MTYFKVGTNDFSAYVSGLSVNYVNNYNAQTNAAGNTVVDYINSKREIEVNIIPLSQADSAKLLAAIGFNVSISYLDPETKKIATANCIIDEKEAEYYTIQDSKVLLQKTTLKFKEL